MDKLSEDVLDWSKRVFGDKFEQITPRIRAMRLLEEAIELAQAEGVTCTETYQIADMVFAKPPGLPFKELGGVIMTMAAYAGIRNFSIQHALAVEFERMQDPDLMERVRRRNLPGGDKIGQLS